MAKSQKRSNPAIRQLNPDVPHPAAGLKGKPDLTARPPVPDNKGQMRGDSTARPLRVAFIGNALPRRCGIATFTTDLEQAVSALPEVADTAIIAMCDPGGNYAWPPSVRFCIDQNDSGQFLAAANFINTNGFDVACLQHEVGIYGGDAGGLGDDGIDDFHGYSYVPLVYRQARYHVGASGQTLRGVCQ